MFTRRKELLLQSYPVRKFAFKDGRIIIGELIRRPEDETYHHSDLMYALLQGKDAQDFERLVAGWLHGSGTEVAVSFGRFGDESELVLAAARRTLREWAQRHGKTLRFESGTAQGEGRQSEPLRR